MGRWCALVELVELVGLGAGLDRWGGLALSWRGFG